LPLTIALQDERGNVIDQLFDMQNVISGAINPLRDSGQLVLLHYVDPYADTTFNQMQMRDVLADIARLMTKVEGEGIAILEKVRTLAERGTRAPHLYLKFLGD